MRASRPRHSSFSFSFLFLLFPRRFRSVLFSSRGHQRGNTDPAPASNNLTPNVSFSRLADKRQHQFASAWDNERELGPIRTRRLNILGADCDERVKSLDLALRMVCLHRLALLFPFRRSEGQILFGGKGYGKDRQADRRTNSAATKETKN